MQDRLDGGYGWAIVLAQYIIASCVFGTSKTSGVLFIYFQDEYNSSYSATASISLVQRITETSTALIFSFLAEKYGSRPVMLIGGIFIVSGALLSAFAKSIPELIVTFGVLVGLGSSMLAYPGGQMLPKYFDKKLAIASALAFCGGSFGPLVFPFIIELAVNYYGLSGSFFILAGVYMHVFVGAVLMRPASLFHRTESATATGLQLESSEEKPPPYEVKATVESKENPTFKSMLNRYLSCFKFKSLLLFYAVHTMGTASIVNFMAYQQAHARDRGITDQTQLASLTSIWGICEIISRIGFGLFLQSGVIAPYRLHQITVLVLTVVYCFYSSMYQYWTIAICSGLVAISWSAIVVCLVPTIRMIVGIELTSTAFGLLCLPVLISYATVQIGGVIRDVMGSFVFIYYFCAFLLFLCVFALEGIAWRLKKSLYHKFTSFTSTRNRQDFTVDLQ